MGLNRAEHDDAWIAVREYLQLVEETHEATVWVRIDVGDSAISARLAVRVVAQLPFLEGAGRTRRVEDWAYWPNADAATVPALVYLLLHRLDARIGRESYQQAHLPF